MLPFAIESVLAQQRGDFELVVICDGAPPATGECARHFAAGDPRIQVRDLAKGERHGELHRDEVLSSARGTYVCQIADDDLWFPNHLEEMSVLLAHCDFGNLTQTNVSPNGQLSPFVYDLSQQRTVERMLDEDFNFFGPTVSGYRLDVYRRLSERWGPAPREIWSDLYMWRKFLRAPGVRAETRHVITSLSFPTPHRRDWSIADRRTENEFYAAMLKTAAGRSQLRADAMRALAARAVEQEIDILKLRRKSYLYRATAKVHRILRQLLARIG